MHAETHTRVSRATWHLSELRGSVKYFVISQWRCRTGKGYARSRRIASSGNLPKGRTHSLFLFCAISIKGSERNDIDTLSSSFHDLTSNDDSVLINFIFLLRRAFLTIHETRRGKYRDILRDIAKCTQRIITNRREMERRNTTYEINSSTLKLRTISCYMYDNGKINRNT